MSNSNSKTLILKDSSIRSIWTYLTASPCYTTNTNIHSISRFQGNTFERWTSMAHTFDSEPISMQVYDILFNYRYMITAATLGRWSTRRTDKVGRVWGSIDIRHDVCVTHSDGEQTLGVIDGNHGSWLVDQWQQSCILLDRGVIIWEKVTSVNKTNCKKMVIIITKSAKVQSFIILISYFFPRCL